MDLKEDLKDLALSYRRLLKVCLQHVPDRNMILCNMHSEGRDLDPSMTERGVPLIRTEGHCKSCHSGKLCMLASAQVSEERRELSHAIF